MTFNEGIKHLQYLGDDGEVGEVGEYFGEAGVISAGARRWLTKVFVTARQQELVILTSYEMKEMARGDQLGSSFRTWKTY
jgi:hypothetical protein